MLTQLCERHGTTLTNIVTNALRYFQDCQVANGSIAEEPDDHTFQDWDSVNALKAMALWHDRVDLDCSDTIQRIVTFLRSEEKPNGMLSWGVLETGPSDFCTETSSEYIAALALLGRSDEARPKADFLQKQQRTSGAWEEVHPHIPKAFQTEPSVTGLAVMALLQLDLDPLYVDEMLGFLAKRQKPEGHFGINWYYYSTYYYLTQPASAALASYGNYPAVAATRDFVLSQQSPSGSWYDRVEGFGEFSSAEQHTAMALATLAHAGLDTSHPAMQRGMDWLLGQIREDGSWDGGPYPYPDTDSYKSFQATQHVFTTARILSLLNHLDALEIR